MILPGCTRGHIRARYVLQGYLIRNLMFGQRWAFLLAIGGPFFFFFLGPSAYRERYASCEGGLYTRAFFTGQRAGSMHHDGACAYRERYASCGGGLYTRAFFTGQQARSETAPQKPKGCPHSSPKSTTAANNRRDLQILSLIPRYSHRDALVRDE